MAQNDIAERAVAAEQAKRAEKVDFKMVTFSLAGKEYGIDIMNVKEIAKAGRFTYVPNAAPLRPGAFITSAATSSRSSICGYSSISPPSAKRTRPSRSLIILKIEEHVFGIIVDGIDKVVGISSAGIQPPHPIFGDINVKYIKGIVENASKLYIILDVERIFAPERETERVADEAAAQARPSVRAAPEIVAAVTGADVASSFREGNPGCPAWVLRGEPRTKPGFAARFDEWKAGRKGADLQIKEAVEADQFLEAFWSPCTGQLWDPDYAAAVAAALPPIEAKAINIWNPGCGKGYETWSLACVLRQRYPETRIKIWANDSDLLSISMAPNMVFPEAVPEYYAPFMAKGRNGLAFVQSIRDSIFFEYHDVMNANPLPPLDMILCRDMISFLAPIDQKRLFGDFIDKLKPNGIVLTGVNERLGEGWTPVGTEAIPAFRKD